MDIHYSTVPLLWLSYISTKDRNCQIKCTCCGVPTADQCVLCHQAMFSLCMVESEADEVTLQGVTSVGLKHALDFAYTGQVSMSNSLQS